MSRGAGAAPGRPAVETFEKLGVFYLGRPYSLENRTPEDGLILYDSKDLVTHAVCVGMTGSGKTGLCISLLEEAALDGVPAIVIDPKGDLTNLLLTFPQLRPADFRPWINEDDARQKGVPLEEYAAQQAEFWRNGLAGWGQDGDRIRRMRDAVDIAIYTPGSSAGIPVSVLSSFAAPPASLRNDSEAFTDLVSTTATSLLGLLGIRADPVNSREHILIATILDAAWRAGQDLDLAGLIGRIQTPPVGKVGVLDLETFYPSADRFQLAVRLNNLLAAPGFATWLDGAPIDVGRFLYTESGKPRIAIFTIAHLSDPERMFFVSLLLNQVLGWMRAQSGTTSLRAILYMDEIFGFFPPVANPPSKPPLLTLLKQARAFGLGVVLATQNPVDLDYKGLSNAGTWFLGRLQTERDKARVLDGLEGVAVTAGATFDRRRVDAILSGLGKRIFLLHNVHEDAPQVFETRWAMSYLRGPLTRDQIRQVMDPLRGATAPFPAAATPAPPQGAAPSASATALRPVLPSGVPQFFVPPLSVPADGVINYEPMLFGAARVQFQDAKVGVDITRDVVVLAPITAGVITVDWSGAADANLLPSDLRSEPVSPAIFGALPPEATKPKNYEGWGREFARWIAQGRGLELLRHSATGLHSNPGESERDFRIRIHDAARQRRDQMLEELRQRYGQKTAALQERLRRAQQSVEREQLQAKQQKIQTAVSLGATILGGLFGRRAISTSTLGRATTAARGASRSYKEAQDVQRAEETVAVLQQQLNELEAQLKAEIDAAAGAVNPLGDALETVAVKPKRTGITVQAVGLAWTPK
ncbi:MAG: type IV secretion system DNA-binding domain-containing protein [bacterium]|nr:type IV secretion system DNA-binding domain-containing protein [bacterium]